MIPATLNLQIDRGTTFGPVVLVCYDENDEIVPLTGYTAHAQARKKPESKSVALDLQPQISNASGGEVTLPEIPALATAALDPGYFFWDFVLENSSGKRYGPFLAGRLRISTAVTRPS